MSLTRFFLILSILLTAYFLIMLAVLFSWVWVAVLIGMAIALCKRRKQFHAFGTARWADITDLRSMVGEGDGLIIGQIEDTTGVIAATKALFDASIPAEVACQQFLGCGRK